MQILAQAAADGPLFQPVKVGRYQLDVRYIFAPLTVSSFSKPEDL